jgi:hypothetical protein
LFHKFVFRAPRLKQTPEIIRMTEKASANHISNGEGSQYQAVMLESSNTVCAPRPHPLVFPVPDWNQSPASAGKRNGKIRLL